MATRNESVPAVKFIPVVMQVHAAGGSPQDIADKLGMNKQSVQVRLSQMRNKKNADGSLTFPGLQAVDFTHLRGGGGGRKLDVDAINAIIESANSDS